MFCIQKERKFVFNMMEFPSSAVWNFISTIVKFYIQQEKFFFYLVVTVNDLWEKTKEHAWVTSWHNPYFLLVCSQADTWRRMVLPHQPKSIRVTSNLLWNWNKNHLSHFLYYTLYSTNCNITCVWFFFHFKLKLFYKKIKITLLQLVKKSVIQKDE